LLDQNIYLLRRAAHQSKHIPVEIEVKAFVIIVLQDAPMMFEEDLVCFSVDK
jgi:hypothetical protein